MKATSHFEHLENKDDPHSLCIFMRALLRDLFINKSKTYFENVSLSDMWNPIALCQYIEIR